MIEYRSSITAELINGSANDLMVGMAAWVSTNQVFPHENEIYDQKKLVGLIRYLMKHRHGTPFEHGGYTFRVECPIFVAREVMRHRMFSFNELSGRYAKLEPVFWMPRATRGLVNVGSSARPTMGDTDPAQHELVDHVLESSYQNDWLAYEKLLEAGIATEVARAVLPVAIYTRFYLTCNARSLMHFLSLRISSKDNTYQTYPQAEIQELAEGMEQIFAECMPLTHAAFVECGRVAP